VAHTYKPNQFFHAQDHETSLSIAIEVAHSSIASVIQLLEVTRISIKNLNMMSLK